MLINRREFARLGIRSITALGLTGAFSRFGLMNAFAQTADYKALVCIFLFGGNDGNNTVIPADVLRNTAYQGMRGGLAITSGLQSLDPTSTGELYGLHPRLKDLAALYNQDRVAAVFNVGPLLRPTTRAAYLARTVPIPANLFSHSDQQSQAQTFAPDSFGTTGWAGRMADSIKSLNGTSTYPAVVSVSGAPVFSTGQITIPASVLPSTDPRVLHTLECVNGPAIFGPRRAGLQQVLRLNSGLTLVQEASPTLSREMDFGDRLNAAVAGASHVNTSFPPDNSLAFQLRQVAHIISARNELGLHRQIFFCSLGGFDNHSNQLEDHDTLLQLVNGALRSFYDSTVELGISSSVTTFLLSEFGRTMGMNAGFGSDHAWGSHLLVMGDAVRGGDAYGRFPELAAGSPDDSGSTGRWIPSTSLDQFGATLATWFGVPDADLNNVFPNLPFFAQRNLGFMSPPSTLSRQAGEDSSLFFSS
jgi:uncharacterized protein (DUF1501 family)